MEGESHSYGIIETPIGKVKASYQGGFLTALEFTEEILKVAEVPPQIHLDLLSQLDEYFKGKRSEFDIPIQSKGTDFQQAVWKLLQGIPYGSQMSYLDLAKEYGDIKAIRAIASANGANPIMILVPCHRVIGSDGSLTGYAGGLWRKEALLDLENGVERLF